MIGLGLLAVSLVCGQVDGGLSTPPLVPLDAERATPIDETVHVADDTALKEYPPSLMPFARVTLFDGQELRGRLRAESSSIVVLQLGKRELSIPRALIQRVKKVDIYFELPNGEVRSRDANRTRYFAVQSAKLLRPGEVSFSQLELIGSVVNIGITEHVGVTVGTALPMYFVNFPTLALNVLAGVKVGYSPTPNWHLAAHAQGMWFPFGSAFSGVGGGILASMTQLMATYGTDEAHVTFSLGLPLLFNATSGSFGGSPLTIFPPAFSIAGAYRVSNLVSLVGENDVIFFTPNSFSYTANFATMAGVRLMGDNVAFDLGVAALWSPGGPQFGAFPFVVPAPILHFTYNFR